MQTTGSIARQLGLDKALVAYLIRKGNIQPIAKAGIARIFEPGAVKQVARLATQHNFRRGLAANRGAGG